MRSIIRNKNYTSRAKNNDVTVTNEREREDKEDNYRGEEVKRRKGGRGE